MSTNSNNKKVSLDIADYYESLEKQKDNPKSINAYSTKTKERQRKRYHSDPDHRKKILRANSIYSKNRYAEDEDFRERKLRQSRANHQKRKAKREAEGKHGHD